MFIAISSWVVLLWVWIRMQYQNKIEKLGIELSILLKWQLIKIASIYYYFWNIGWIVLKEFLRNVILYFLGCLFETLLFKLFLEWMPLLSTNRNSLRCITGSINYPFPDPKRTSPETSLMEVFSYLYPSSYGLSRISLLPQTCRITQLYRLQFC